MRTVIQRVSEASVVIKDEKVANIQQGLLVLIGIEIEDTEEDVHWLAKKISTLRIFSDLEGKMNNSILDIDGDIIVVSQFTLHAKTKKGTRPSYMKSARPKKAIPLYEKFKKELSEAIAKQVYSGQFGSDMKVSLVNDGPITILLDSKNK